MNWGQLPLRDIQNICLLGKSILSLIRYLNLLCISVSTRLQNNKAYDTLIASYLRSTKWKWKWVCDTFSTQLLAPQIARVLENSNESWLSTTKIEIVFDFPGHLFSWQELQKFILKLFSWSWKSSIYFHLPGNINQPTGKLDMGNPSRPTFTFCNCNCKPE